MKKLIAMASAMLISLSAFAAGTFSANDAAVSDLAPGKKVTVNRFTINGAEKGGRIEDKSKEPVKNGDKSYNKRLQFKGADGYIEFSAKKGEKITVVATSSSKSDARAIRVQGGPKNKKLGDITAPAWNANAPAFTQGSLEVPEDGTYKVKGFGGGVYIFEVIVQ